jgi:hypothetical protein
VWPLDIERHFDRIADAQPAAGTEARNAVRRLVPGIPIEDFVEAVGKHRGRRLGVEIEMQIVVERMLKLVPESACRLAS